MPTALRCAQPSCNGQITVQDDHLGEALLCPLCGHPFVSRPPGEEAHATGATAGGTHSLASDNPVQGTLTLPPPSPPEATWSLPPAEAALPPASGSETPLANAGLKGQAFIETLGCQADRTTVDVLPAARPDSSWNTLPPAPETRLAPGGKTETAKATASWDTAATPALPDAELPERIGRFLVRQLLGEGAFGRVYRAHDEQLDREVAVKVAKAETLNRPHRVERFLREARAAAQLRHPHIVPLFDAGREGRQYYIASAFISGRTLEATLQEGRPDFRRTAQVVRALAEALAYAHDQGIVHRDVKPANVMMDDKGQPMLMDFGLAARQDEAEKLTHEGTIMGTPLYMAPEQAAGKSAEVGPASDQYSLGVILYEMLCGLTPFAGPPQVVLVSHQQVEPLPLRKRDRHIPRDLETICLKALAKKPRERYAGCRELAEDLRRFLDDEPIRVRQANLVEQMVRWARRKPTQAGLAAVSLLALAALVALVLLFARNKAQQASMAQAEVKRLQEHDDVRERSSRKLLTAQQHEAAGQWADADRELASALAALDAQPDLRADELRAELLHRRDVVQQRLREQQRREQASVRLRAFQVPYDVALLHETGFTSQDVARNRTTIRDAVHKALALYGLDPEPDPTRNAPTLLEQDRSWLGDAEYSRLAEACYELLLIWADTEGALPPDQVEKPEQTRQRAGRALALLDRAARLGQAHGLDTRAYHLCKARYTALARGEPFDPGKTDWQSVLPKIDPAAPPKPTGALDWFLEGLERYRAGQWQQASRACAEALARQGNHFWARYIHALCQLREGRWVDAKAELTVCLNGREDYPWPRLLRGFAASELGFRHSLHKEEALADAEFKAAQEDFDSVLKGERDPLVQYVGLSNRGVLHIRRQQWQEAVRDLQEASRVNPTGFQAQANLAQAQQGLQQWDEALAALDRAIQLAPGLAGLYESRAKLHLLRKERAAARADFEQAINLEPKDSKSDRLVSNLVELGRLLHREHKYAAALAAFDRSLRLRPDYVLAQRFRAESLLALDRNDEAARALDAYLAVNRNAPPEVYQARGLIYAGAGRLPAAIDLYSAALQQHPQDTATRRYRGWAYLLTDSVRLALEDFETCLKEDPTNADALVGRGTARIRLRQLEGALADAAEAEKQGRLQDKLTDRLLYNLACLYSQATAQAALEARTARPPRDQQAARQATRLEEKALQFLNRTLEAVKEERRAAFWRDQVQTDPALEAVRHGTRYLQLAKEYGRTGM